MDNFRFWGLCRYKVCVNSCPLLDPCLPLPSHQVSVQAQEGDTVELPCKVRLSTEQSILPLLNNLFLTLIIVYFTSQTPLDFVLIFSLLLCFLKKLLFKLQDCSEKKTAMRQNKTKKSKVKQNKTQIQLNVLLKQTSMYFASKTPPCILLKQTPQNPALYFA